MAKRGATGGLSFWDGLFQILLVDCDMHPGGAPMGVFPSGISGPTDTTRCVWLGRSSGILVWAGRADH